MEFSLNEIQELSPDEASIKAAKGLVVPGKWPSLGVDDLAIWGECQGSGSRPYQVQVDKSGPAFKCTCPSRKFPCKHGLALLLLLNQHKSAFTANVAPSWVSEWLQSRQEKTEKQAAKKAEAVKPIDPEAQAKREEKREQRMAGGLNELSTWLQDQIRQGLAGLPSRAEQISHLSTRMVDAQLPGIAARIRQWLIWLEQDSLWSEKILADWGLLQLLIDAFPRLSEFNDALKTDILSALGVSFDKAQIIESGEIIEDDWIVLGQTIYEENRLWIRRAWLQSCNTQKIILMLDFSHGFRKFEHSLLNGSCVHVKIALQSGRGIQRGIFVEAPVMKTTINTIVLPPLFSLEKSLDLLTTQTAENPWRFQQALVVSNATIMLQGDSWFLISEEKQIPLDIPKNQAWKIYSESGGETLHFFGEWQANQLRPLSVWKNHWLWHQQGEAA